MEAEKGSSSHQDLYEALSARRYFPFRVGKENDWMGLSFVSGHFFLLTPLEEIAGIMPVILLSSIPGAKPWIRGVTTYHSHIFPVADLSEFLIQQKTKITKDSRILMIRAKEGYYGLLIDAALNLHRIDKDKSFNPASE